MPIIHKIISHLVNAKREEFTLDSALESTLHDAIINKFKDIDMNIELGHYFKFDTYTPSTFNDIPAVEHYTDLNLQPYVSTLVQLSEKVDELDNYFEDKRQRVADLAKDIRMTETTMSQFIQACKKRKFNYSKGDSLEEFDRKNARNKYFLKLPESEKERARNIVSIVKKTISDEQKAYNDELEFFAPIEHTLNLAKSSAMDLAKNLGVIQQTQQDKTNLKLSVDDIDTILIDLIYGNISRTRALKDINKIKEENKIAEQNKIRLASKSSQNSISDNVNNQETAPIILLDGTYFRNLGINNTLLKQLCEDKEKYNSAKYFISSLETIFNDAGLDKKQINVLVQKNPSLLFESKKTMKDYLNLTERLYDLINPTNVSGIHPSNNPDIYVSIDTLHNLILKEESKKKNIHIINPELITDEKDKETFENRLNCAKSRDERIQKYISRKAGKKTILYERYSSEFGEGTYMKVKLGKGGRRIIYKLEPAENTINVRVINYFMNHDDHVNFFKPK